MAPGNVTPRNEDPSVPESEEIMMRCCQKTRELMRDCECAVPDGPCMAPPLVFTHYHPECLCFSCEWLRVTKLFYITNRIPGRSGHEVQNPTYAANQSDNVLETHSVRPSTGPELVYPLLLKENPAKWEWVFRPGDEYQIPFLAPLDQMSSVSWVTVGSNGGWKALRKDGTSFALHYDRRPVWNQLYRDYGYAPECSPYGPKGDSEFSFTPDKVNPEGYVAPQLPNKSRENSASQINTTLFIGGINKSVTDEKLEQLFLQFGQITYVNRPHQTSGFVQFALRRDALMAMRQMQGVPIYNCRLRISWGDAKVKNQWEIQRKAGERPFKGNNSQHLQQPPRVPQQIFQGFNNMSGPQNQQQLYCMHYVPPATVYGVWYPQFYQYLNQQMMGYCPEDMPQPPPPPPTPFTAPRSPPGLPQRAHIGHPPSPDISAASRKGSLNGKGPLVVSSDMVPNPYHQDSHGQAARGSNSESSFGSNKANASSGDEKSHETSTTTSPGKDGQPAGDSKSAVGNEGEIEITRMKGAGPSDIQGWFVKEP